MTRIWDRLYLGNYQDADALNKSNPEEIKAVLNCTPDKIDYYSKSGITAHVMDIHDGCELSEEKFWQAVNFIKEHMFKGESVLVHCHAGISRSASITAAYMYLTGFGQLERCIDFIKRARPIVQPHMNIITSIKRHLKLYPYDQRII
jgi:predicted protein tyrosine phosphatase